MMRQKLEQVLADMQSADPRVAKGGVQAACELLESRPVPARTRSRISRALSVQLSSTDEQVRRWTYKLVALLRDPTYTGFLERQLAEVDMVAENRTWAVAAMSALNPNFLQGLYDAGEELTVPYALAAGMYRTTGLEEHALRAATNGDDPLAHQWLGLLYGEGRADLDRVLVSELTTSPSPEVVEYVIWGVRLRRKLGIESINIDPTSLAQQQVNIRRWYYRTVAQDPKARNVYAAQVIDWIETDPDSKAREGLARGLHESKKDKFWRDVHSQWRRQEPDPFVLRALGVPVATMDLTAVTDPGAAVGLRLEVDRPLMLQALPEQVRRELAIDPNTPIERHTIVVQYNPVNVTNNGTIGQVAGAHSTLNTGPVSVSSGVTGAETINLLTVLAEHLRAMPVGTVAPEVLEEVEALAAEEAALDEVANAAGGDGGTAEAGSLEPRRRRFGERLSALATTLRGAGAATAATTGLVEQVEHLAHTILS